MDLSSINPVLLLASLMVAATPILLAAIGELVVERAGVLNLGVEGMMIIGAVCGFIVAVNTGSPWLGFIGAAVGGMAVSLVFGVLTQFLLSKGSKHPAFLTGTFRYWGTYRSLDPLFFNMTQWSTSGSFL